MLFTAHGAGEASEPGCFPTRRNWMQWMATGALGAAMPAAWAQASPPVLGNLRIVIPANEGGGWDQTGRALGAAMLASGAVAQVSYENVGGKGGTIGLAQYAQKYNAAPDTLLMSGMVMVGAVALQKSAVDLRAVQPVARLTSDYEVVAVRTDSAIQTPKDLINRLRTEPGSTPIAGGSAGGVDHVYAGMLARVAGRTADLTYQPYPGGAQVVEALLSGKAAVGISGLSEFSDSIASGKLRAIGVSSKRPFLGIPSIREQGVDADLANWRGVFTGKGVPPAAADVLLEAVRRGVAHDAWQKAIKRSNWDASWMEGKNFAGFLDLDISMAGVMIYLLKLKQG